MSGAETGAQASTRDARLSARMQRVFLRSVGMFVGIGPRFGIRNAGWLKQTP